MQEESEEHIGYKTTKQTNSNKHGSTKLEGRREPFFIFFSAHSSIN